MAYSRRIKETAIRMMLPPENKSINQIHEVLGTSEATLKKWRQDLRANGHSAPANDGLADEWSSRDKFFSLQAGRRIDQEFLAYDTTSVSSYSKLLKQVRYGKNKDHDPLPQINLALLYGDQSRLPVQWIHVDSFH